MKVIEMAKQRNVKRKKVTSYGVWNAGMKVYV